MSLIVAVLTAAGTTVCGIATVRAKGRARLWWIAGAALLIALNAALQSRL